MFCFLLFFFRTHQIKCDGTGENRGDADEMIPVKRLAEKYGARQDAYDGGHIVEKPYVHRRKRLQRIGGEKRGDQGGKHSQEKDRQQEGGVGKRSKEFCQRTCRRMSPCCHRIEKEKSHNAHGTGDGKWGVIGRKSAYQHIIQRQGDGGDDDQPKTDKAVPGELKSVHQIDEDDAADRQQHKDRLYFLYPFL